MDKKSSSKDPNSLPKKAAKSKKWSKKPKECIHSLSLTSLASEETPESEDEEGRLLNDKVEKKFFETIDAIRRVGEEIKDPNKTFFAEEDFDLAEKESTLKEKPIFYKDLIRKDVLDKMAEEDGEEKKEGEEEKKQETFNEEQKRIKEEFMAEVQKADEKETDDLFKKKEKTKEEAASEEKEFDEFIKVFTQM